MPVNGLAPAEIILLLSPLAFIVGASTVRNRSQLGYFAAISGGVIGLATFAWTEFSNLDWGNSWIMLNVPAAQETPAWSRYRTAGALSILSVLLTLISLSIALFRVEWRPLRVMSLTTVRRALLLSTICLLSLGIWFLISASPYRIAGIVHGGGAPDLAILRIEKHGLQFVENRITVLQDGKYFVWKTQRTLFQYRFTGQGGYGVLPPEIASRAFHLARGMASLTPTPRPTPLRAWDAEGWYVLGSNLLVAFANEQGSSPPSEVIRLFDAITKLAFIQEYNGESGRDVCLGFCYDPMAALGFAYKNYHCGQKPSGTVCPSS